MNDPALGPTRGQKSGMKPQDALTRQFRNVNVGMYSGPKPTYQRYNVSEQASDILNRSIRNMDTR
jgi:hypothetical protein